MKRKDFLKQLGIIGGGTAAISLGGMPLKAFAKPFMNINTFNGKILVVLQLKGGNDGLNTIIPFEDDLYYHNRPTLAIQKNDVIPITNSLGFHPSMASLKPLFDEGKMSIIQNVGYTGQDRSHFRSTDIWLTASDVDKYYYDGWLGRTLVNAFPDYPGVIPEQPMAVEMGSSQSLLLESQHGGMGISFNDPWTFSRLLRDSTIDDEPVPDTLAGEELKFLKQVASQSIKYAEVVKKHANDGWHDAEYPETWIGWQLRIIANLIAGKMETPVYVASHWGFDTHAQQGDVHTKLLKEFSEAVVAFQKDIEEQGYGDKIIIMTISEFGRRVAQNGSFGTDHGAAAPMFVFGNSVEGGIYGNQIDLTNLDEFGDLKHQYDFRQIYSTIMQNYLGIGHTATTNILKGEFTPLSFVVSTDRRNNNLPTSYSLSQNYPNPFNPTTKIEYSIPKAGNVSIIIFDMLGRRVGILINGYHKPGNYSVNFSANSLGQNLASGSYVYQLRAGNSTNSATIVETKKMLLLK